MIYSFNVIQFLLSMDDHLARIKNAERIRHIWRITIIFVVASMLIYACSAYIGIGSSLLLKESLSFTPDVYESSKFWFIIGRTLYGAFFALFIIFIPAILFKWLTNIAFKKLVLMQLVVLFVLLAERIIWFFLVLTAGLDWYVSPLSFGIIASYLTGKTWVIYFFGAISLFQIWIIWFQVKYMSSHLTEGKMIIWITVFMLHFIEWWIAALSAIISPLLIGGWFG